MKNLIRKFFLFNLFLIINESKKNTLGEIEKINKYEIEEQLIKEMEKKLNEEIQEEELDLTSYLINKKKHKEEFKNKPCSYNKKLIELIHKIFSEECHTFNSYPYPLINIEYIWETYIKVEKANIFKKSNKEIIYEFENHIHIKFKDLIKNTKSNYSAKKIKEEYNLYKKYKEEENSYNVEEYLIYKRKDLPADCKTYGYNGKLYIYHEKKWKEIVKLF